MKIGAYYSHLNGLEWMLQNFPELWEEINETIDFVDGEECRTKVSEEKQKKGEILYSPTAMNAEFKKRLYFHGWEGAQKNKYYITSDSDLTRQMIESDMSLEEQRRFLEEANAVGYIGRNESDFFKERVSIEVQFGKYAFVQYDIFIKHAADYMNNRIDLGVEIVPMKSLQMEMSSGPTNYERNLHEILRQGRIFPPVPLILIGVEP